MARVMGRLGAADMSANTDTLLYAVPASKAAALAVSLVARTASARVRLAITTGGTPAATDYIEYGADLPVSGVLERTGLALSAGQKLYARADVTGVTALVWGVEEDN